MKPPSEITQLHPIMKCPACGDNIYGEATLSVTFGDPEPILSTEAVTIPATGQIERLRIQHACTGRVRNEVGS